MPLSNNVGVKTIQIMLHQIINNYCFNAKLQIKGNLCFSCYSYILVMAMRGID